MTTTRGVGIAARTAHLAGVALLVGGAVAGAHRPLWDGLVFTSGLVLLGTEVAHDIRHWAVQGCGFTTMAHVAVLAVIPLAPQLTSGVLLLALCIGSIGSHLPRAARKWSLWHGRVLE
jgi:hypothetical protein